MRVRKKGQSRTAPEEKTTVIGCERDTEEERKEKGQLAGEGDTVRKDGRGNGTERNTRKIARGSRAEGQQ